MRRPGLRATLAVFTLDLHGRIKKIGNTFSIVSTTDSFCQDATDINDMQLLGLNHFPMWNGIRVGDNQLEHSQSDAEMVHGKYKTYPIHCITIFDFTKGIATQNTMSCNNKHLFCPVSFHMSSRVQK